MKINLIINKKDLEDIKEEIMIYSFIDRNWYKFFWSMLVFLVLFSAFIVYYMIDFSVSDSFENKQFLQNCYKKNDLDYCVKNMPN